MDSGNKDIEKELGVGAEVTMGNEGEDSTVAAGGSAGAGTTETSGLTSVSEGMGMGATGEDSGTEGMERGTLSPLTGSYLLIVLAEPHSEEDREVIIQRLIKGERKQKIISS